jgi:ElaB/YqjD/DUF883 family membrane-anchored ribosome-binding protein
MDQEGTSGNGAHQHRPRIGERVEHIESSAQQMWNEARGAVTDITQTLDIGGRVQRHPYAMLAAAAGIGYVLGGGLFTGLTGKLLRIGVRLAALPFVKEELFNLAEGALATFAQRADDSKGSARESAGA